MYLAIFWNPLYKPGDFFKKFKIWSIRAKFGTTTLYMFWNHIFQVEKNEKKSPMDKTLVSVW
jgi:hypothetical protein